MGKCTAKILSLVLAALILSLTVVPASAAASAAASAMQLMKFTGAVNVTNSAGRSLAKWNNMRLYSGYRVQTGARSYAWINLDGTKLAKLDASSKVEIRRSGSKLELLLSSGHIYFNVTSPLAPGETLNIRTSTMVTGIRGTCGWINVVDRGTTEIYVLEGTVRCSATDPVTGQVRTAAVGSGEKAVASAYPQDREGDKCDILRERFEAGDINGFVLEELARDPGLCGEILERSGLDVSDAVEAAQERLERDERELQDVLDRIGEELAGQDSGVSSDPVGGTGKDPAPGGGSGGGATRPPAQEDDPTPGSVVQLKMPVGPEELQGYLKDKKVTQVILEPAPGHTRDENTLTVRDFELTVPEGKTLTVSEGVDVIADSSALLTVKGLMDAGKSSFTIGRDGGLGVSGVLRADSITAAHHTSGIYNYSGGQIAAANGITNNGSFYNAGTVDGDVADTASFDNSRGTINGEVTLAYGGGINGGAITRVVQTGGAVHMTGGTVTEFIQSGGTAGFSDGEVTEFVIEGGSATVSGSVNIDLVYAMGTSSCVMAGGTVTGGVSLNDSSSFSMTGGTVDGLVDVLETSLFVMESADAAVNGINDLPAVKVDGGTFIMDGGEITSSSSDATLSVAGGHLTLNGGRITNSEDGYALSMDESVFAAFDGTVLRATRDDLLLHGAFVPEGYEITRDAEGYYCLTRTGSGSSGNAGGEGRGEPREDRGRGVMVMAGGLSLFTDVPDTAWYSEAARYVRERGLMDGTGGGAFSPDSPMSRGMLVTVLYRMEGSPAAGSVTFADVPDGRWYTHAVAWADENGIVNGRGDGSFGPNDPVTREQMAAILYRYAGYKGYAVTSLGAVSAFPDGDEVSPYAADAVGWAVGSGLLRGTGGDMLAPAGGATRAQAAAVLMRLREDAARSYPMAVVSVMDVMYEPGGILFLEDGSFLVTDTYNNVIWRVSDGSGAVYAGGGTVSDPYGRPMGGYNDAALDKSCFNDPWAIVPFRDGFAVSDAGNNAVRLILDGSVQTLGGSTREDRGAAFDQPTGLACDGEGNLYVSDTLAGAVRKITPEGAVSTLIDGLSEPMGLCWKDGTLYIAETGANRIVKTADGRLTVVAGGGDGLADGPAARAAFTAPQGVAVGEDGTLYVSDTVNGAVRRIRDGVVTTLALRDESDLDAFIPVSPAGLTVRGDRLYVCDSFARKIFVISLAQ